MERVIRDYRVSCNSYNVNAHTNYKLMIVIKKKF
jgi:hypothetical protein